MNGKSHIFRPQQLGEHFLSQLNWLQPKDPWQLIVCLTEFEVVPNNPNKKETKVSKIPKVFTSFYTHSSSYVLWFIYGCFLKWWYPKNDPFLVGKTPWLLGTSILGNHHIYICFYISCHFIHWNSYHSKQPSCLHQKVILLTRARTSVFSTDLLLMVQKSQGQISGMVPSTRNKSHEINCQPQPVNAGFLSSFVCIYSVTDLFCSFFLPQILQIPNFGFDEPHRHQCQIGGHIRWGV